MLSPKSKGRAGQILEEVSSSSSLTKGPIPSLFDAIFVFS